MKSPWAIPNDPRLGERHGDEDLEAYEKAMDLLFTDFDYRRDDEQGRRWGLAEDERP